MEIDDVYAIIVPNEYNETLDLKVKLLRKQKEVEKFMAKEAESSKSPEDLDESDIMKSLYRTILKNLRISINRIHLRFEDEK